ncbi:MAG TPA: hypothetical protein VMA77_31880 [Solirubrobacteraceae bacterium]|nr:hypothetical protein [Solirubrobacteraceae bacterium]
MTSALIVDAIVLFAVLEANLGPHRKVGRLRLLRPFLVVAAIVPMFLKPVVTSGHGLDTELALAAAGIALGLLAASLMSVSREKGASRVVTAAGWAYALVWIVMIAARAAFSFGAEHWFTHSLVTWQIHHAVSTAAITDALIFSAVAMILAHTALLALRAHHADATDSARLHPVREEA